MDRELEKLAGVVRESGRIVREAWDKARRIRHKGCIDLVTETDVAVEGFLKEALAPLIPGASFMAEESAEDMREPATDCWIIDPVDGTTNFVHRIPQVATSVALWRNGRPEMGVINLPMLDECYCARRGCGAFLNGRPIRVSRAARMQDALVATGFPYNVPDNLETVLGWLRQVLPAAQGVRRIGAAAVDLAYVACGRLDAFYELGLKPWDFAAGWLLVEESGGIVSDTDGAPLTFERPLLASNGLVHADMVRLLRIGAAVCMDV